MSVLIAGTHANCELALSAADERRDGGGQSVGGRKKESEREISWGGMEKYGDELQKENEKTEKRKLED